MSDQERWICPDPWDEREFRGESGVPDVEARMLREKVSLVELALVRVEEDQAGLREMLTRHRRILDQMTRLLRQLGERAYGPPPDAAEPTPGVH